MGDKFNVKDIAGNMDKLVKEAVQSLNNFRSLTSANDFQIAFHPILDARTGSVHHYEALVRFNGNFEESPYKYITFAEEAGLIPEFDIAMARKCVDWPAQEPLRQGLHRRQHHRQLGRQRSVQQRAACHA